MYNTPSAPRLAQTDLAFFSPSRSSQASSSTVSSVTITTRVVKKKPGRPPRTDSLSADPIPRHERSLEQPVKRRSNSVALPRTVKRLRRSESVSSRASSRQRSPPEPIYRTASSSRSSLPAESFRDLAYKDDFDTTQAKVLTAETVVNKLVKKSNSYKAYFRNLADPEDKRFEPDACPSVDLEYPNTNSSERFVLLAPKDKDHYNPIMCLEKTIYTIVQYYMTPEQQALFGPIPNQCLMDSSPSPSPPGSPQMRATSIAAESDSSLSSLASSPPRKVPVLGLFPETVPKIVVPPKTALDMLAQAAIEGPEAALELVSPRMSEKVPQITPPVNYLRTLQRAIHRQDGPLFLEVMRTINCLLRKLKYPTLSEDIMAGKGPNSLKQHVHTWDRLPKEVLLRVLEENYQRSVGPNIARLKQYEAFTSTVYGELMPSLSYDIMHITGLNENSFFMDLGSGVANVVVQAALQTGCRSFGIELVEGPAEIAGGQVLQFQKRCAMWGLNVGKMELEHGDMIGSEKVDRYIKEADVVLVDNKVFEQSLNEQLRPKFLDLKEGAIVVSLAPFAPTMNARVTERNVDDISTIFTVSEREYGSGSVSWANGGGSYYIHRVDRTGYAQMREKFERGERTRGTRSRR